MAGSIDLGEILSLIFSVGTSPVLLSILGAHIFFNMKELGEKGLNQGTSCGMGSIASRIDFVVPAVTTVENVSEDAARSRDDYFSETSHC